MTPVRQDSAATPQGRKAATRKGGGRTATKAGPGPATSSVAQVRLQGDEMAALRDVMRQLGLTTTSDALREGIRLLVREAREVAAAQEIQQFYAGEQAPLPEGVTPATQEELAAADAEQW